MGWVGVGIEVIEFVDLYCLYVVDDVGEVG